MHLSDETQVAIARAAAAVIAIPVNALFTPSRADRPINPSFPLTIEAARADLRRMERNPRPLQRPVVVCAGIFDPGTGARVLAARLRRVTTTPERVLALGFWVCADFEGCCAACVRLINDRFPADYPRETVPVDAIGVSMGGLVARFAAMPVDSSERCARRRLNIRRLFTLGTPHHGASWWDRAPWDSRAAQMKPDGPFIRELNGRWISDHRESHPRAYSIHAYVRLGDQIVGERNAAAPDGRAWWLPNPAAELAHVQAFDDPRMLADIARRLRDEPPHSYLPTASIPPPEAR